MSTINHKDYFSSPEAQRIQAEMQSAMQRADIGKQTQQLIGTNCYVCYLDIDGFKSKLFSDPHELYESYKQQQTYIINQFFRASGQASGSEVSIQHYDKILWPYLFSDSWFFSTIDSSPEALKQISSVATGVFMRFWEIGFPAKGAIAEGPLWREPQLQMMLGKGLAKAYMLAESIDCFGIAIHPEIENRGDENTFTTKHQVPYRKLKFGFIKQTTKLKFSRIKAYDNGTNFNTDSYLKTYDKMSESYFRSHKSKRKVVNRYKRSRPIIEKMLK